VLIILGGLPATGKSTISHLLARELKAVYLRIDSIEQAIRDAFLAHGHHEKTVISEGYESAYAIARDNLELGHIIIADSVNPINLTRDAWREVALIQNKPFIEVEIICSDKKIHRDRVEKRRVDIKGLTPPTWVDVIEREYTPWKNTTLTIDTASTPPKDAVNQILAALN
jgi:predicted kinase